MSASRAHVCTCGKRLRGELKDILQAMTANTRKHTIFCTVAIALKEITTRRTSLYTPHIFPFHGLRGANTPLNSPVYAVLGHYRCKEDRQRGTPFRKHHPRAVECLLPVQRFGVVDCAVTVFMAKLIVCLMLDEAERCPSVVVFSLVGCHTTRLLPKQMEMMGLASRFKPVSSTALFVGS